MDVKPGSPTARVFDEAGRCIDLIDSRTLCAVLDISKPETLISMAKRGDLPAPIYLNAAGKKKRGRNMVRWNLPEILRQLGVLDAA